MENKFATLEQCVFIYTYKSIAYADKVVGHAIFTKRFVDYLIEKVDENWPKPLMFFVQPRVPQESFSKIMSDTKCA